MVIERTIKNSLLRDLNQINKVIILYGARQVGKTTLVNQVLKGLDYNVLYVNADESKYINVLSSRDLDQIKSLVKGYNLLFIDEAQRIPNIGINLKIIHDQIPELKVIVTGSSSLEIADEITEPLTGRKIVYHLYPISFSELRSQYNDFELNNILEARLIYGSYPELFSIENNEQKRKYLLELSSSYLYKDVLRLVTIKKSNKITDLLRLLAYQIGSEVSLNEIAYTLDLDKETVARYIDLLEKSFVLFRLGGFNRNLRKEVSKMDKIYFYDLGIRNVLIDDFKVIKERNDIGQLWENFLIVERMKYLDYQEKYTSNFFWRTYTGAELDYIEEENSVLGAYEFKWGRKKKNVPASWLESYPNSKFNLINRENYIDFIS